MSSYGMSLQEKKAKELESILTTLKTRRLTSENLLRMKNAVAARGRSPTHPTGIDTLDTLTWGVHKGEVVFFAARPSQGKSNILMQIAWNLALQKCLVLYFSLEMSEDSVLERLMCHDQKINGWFLRMGIFPSDYDTRCVEHKKRFDQTRMEVIDNLGGTKEEIAITCDYVFSNDPGLAEKYGPIVIVVDHVQMCSMGGFRTKMEAIEEYVRALKVLAIKYNAIVLAASQINRQGANSEMGMEFAKGSGIIEEIADIFVHCRWPSKCKKADGKAQSEDKNEYWLDVCKNRHGPTDSVKIKYDPTVYTFSDWEV